MSSLSLLGRTFVADSQLHRMNSSVKLLAAIALMVIVLLSQHPLILLFMTILTLLLIKLSKLPFSLVLKSVRPILFIIIFAFIIHGLSGQGETIASFWIFRISLEGIVTGALTALRITLLVINTSLFLTLTTPPTALADGVERLLSPLRHLRFPVNEFAMMMSIALRFVPTLLEEANKLMKAQSSRGASYDTGGLIKKVRGLVSILVPLFISSFRRAEDLAVAMEARCYQGEAGRTRRSGRKLTWREYSLLALIVILLLLVAVVQPRLPQIIWF
ncbi:MAG: energy-coupling factor transporter transmembrane component T [Eubacteriales bacterium]|nr:energy-coupling factor transporter transmembrane component T [Eubacteriales bacterium]MDD4324514.1 energy-coupling factor transporter transmembrane component T [Eubacteriales bacterium]MDD4540800.1 energy-coupling factor transporter transmembrane component T [Eubacteriales bacterium]